MSAMPAVIDLQDYVARLERERDELRATVATLSAQVAAQTEQIATQTEQITHLLRIVERFEKKLDALMRELEKRDAVRAAKEREEIAKEKEGLPPAPPAPEDVPRPPPAPDREKQQKGHHAHGRNMDVPPGVPVDEAKLCPKNCLVCGSDDLRVKEDVAHEAWHYVAPHLRRRRLVCTTVVCNDCGARTTAEPPPPPFPRASCTSALLAQVLYAKFALFLPLERQAREYARLGVPLSPSTLCDWVAKGTGQLEVIYDLLWMQALSLGHLNFDATGLLVLQGKGKAHYGQVYAFCTQVAVVFRYEATKKAEPLLKLLASFRGTLGADASGTHDALFAGPLPALRTEAGCNAHGRRKFSEIVDSDPDLALEGVRWVSAIYDKEHEARDLGLKGGELLEFRRQHIAPIAADFRLWLDFHSQEVLPKSLIAKAIGYYHRHWNALMRFLHDPDVALDNNVAERALKMVALGRKNMLFAGAETGAESACIAYTLIETCKLFHVDPYTYLVWAFDRLAHRRENGFVAVEDLTPAAYAAGPRQPAPHDTG